MTPTTSSPQERRRRMLASERRALIDEAALAEFSQHGYDQASLGRIAERAGITRTVLYSHFESKRTLYESLLRAGHNDYLARLRAVLADRATTLERFEAAVDATLGFAQERPDAWRLLHPTHPPMDPEVAADQRRIQSSARRLHARMLAPDAERAGLEPRSAVARSYFALQGAAVDGLVHWWLDHPEVKRADVQTAAVKALYLGIQGMEQGG